MESLLVLQHTAAFRDVPAPILEQLLLASTTQTLTRGARLFAEQQAATRVYVLVSGVARTYYLTKQAREFTVAVHAARSVLGVQSVFSARQAYAVSAEILEPAEVIRLDAAHLEWLVARDAMVASALLRFVVSRQQALLQRVDEVFFADLNAKLARVLLKHHSVDGWLLPPNSLLAAELGTVPELISRKLGEFYRMGLIRLQKRRVWVVNVRALQALLE